MPIYNVRLNDGSSVRVEAPENATRRQLAYAVALEQMQAPPAPPVRPTAPVAAAEPEPEEGFFESVGSTAFDVAAGIAPGAVGLGELAALGGAALLPEEREEAARASIRQAAARAREAVTPRRADTESTAFEVGSAIGSTLPTLALGGIGGLAGRALLGSRLAPAAATSAGGIAAGLPVVTGAAAGEARERARAAGLEYEDLGTPTLRGAAVGPLELLPLGRFVAALKIPGVDRFLSTLEPQEVTGVLSRLRNAISAGVVEGTQEGVSAYLQNEIERAYNADQERFEGVIGEVGLGAGAGATLQTVLDLFTRGRPIGAGDTEVFRRPGDPQDLTEVATESDYFDPTFGFSRISPEIKQRLDALGIPAVEGQKLTAQQVYALEKSRPPVEPAAEPTAEAPSVVPPTAPVAEDMDILELLREAGLEQEARDFPVLEAPLEEDVADVVARSPYFDPEFGAGRVNEQIQNELRDLGMEAEVGDQLTTAQVYSLQKAREAAEPAARDTRTADMFEEAQRREQEQEAPTTGPMAQAMREAQRRQAFEQIEAEQAAQREAELDRLQNLARAEREVEAAPELRPAEPPMAQEPAPLEEPVQESLPGMGRPYQRGVAEEPAPEPRVVTREELRGIGLAGGSRLVKRIAGKPFESEEVQSEIANFVGNMNVSPEQRTAVRRWANETAAEQQDLFAEPISERARQRQEAEARRRDRPVEPVVVPEEVTPEPPPAVAPEPVPVEEVAAEPEAVAPEPEAAAPAIEIIGQPPRTKAMQAFLEKERGRVVAVGVEEDGVRIYTRSDLDPADDGSGTFFGASETAAIKDFYARIQPRQQTEAAPEAQPEPEPTPESEQEAPTASERREQARPAVAPDLEAGLAAMNAYANSVGVRTEEQALDRLAYDLIFRESDSPIAGATGRLGRGQRETPPSDLALAWVRENGSEKSNRLLDKLIERAAKNYMGQVDMTATMENKDDLKGGGAAQTTVLSASRAKSKTRLQSAIQAMKQEALSATPDLAKLKELSRQIYNARGRNLPTAIQIPLDERVRTALARNNLPEALRALADTTPNARIKSAARRILRATGNTNVRLQTNLRDSFGRPVAGFYNEAEDTIYLDRESGMSAHALIHEASHPVIMPRIRENKMPAVKQLRKEFAEYRPYFEQTYAATDVEEFVSEYLGNPEFFTSFAAVHPASGEITPFRRILRLIGNILRSAIGMPTKPMDNTRLDDVIDQILAPRPGLYNAVMLANANATNSNEEYLSRFLGSFKGKKTKKLQADGAVIDSMVSSLDSLASGGRLSGFGVELAASVVLGTKPMGDMLEAFNITGGTEFHTTLKEYGGALDLMAKQHSVVVKDVAEWANKNPDLKEQLDELDELANLNQVDPETFVSPTRPQDVEPALYAQMKSLWDNIGPEGKKHLRAMRRKYAEYFDRFLSGLDSEIEAVLPGQENAAPRAQIQNYLRALMTDGGRLRYFTPLYRKGPYWLSYIANGKEAVQTFEDAGARARAIAELESAPVGEISSISAFSIKDMENFRGAPVGSLPRRMIEVLDSSGAAIPEETRERLARMVISAMPETSILRSMQRRKGTPGAIRDTLSVFRERGLDIGRDSVRMPYGRKLRDIANTTKAAIQAQRRTLSDLEGQARDALRSGDQEALAGVRRQIDLALRGSNGRRMTSGLARVFSDELDARVGNVERSFGLSPFERGSILLNQIGFLGAMSLSPASVGVQTMHVPVVAMPKAESETSPDVATKAFTVANLVYGGAGTKNRMVDSDGTVRDRRAAPSIANYFSTLPNGQLQLREEFQNRAEGAFTLDTPTGPVRYTKTEFLELIRPLIQKASDQGILGRGVFIEQLGFEEGVDPRDTFNKAVAITGLPVQLAETYARQVSLVGFFLNELHRLNNNPNANKREDQLSGDALVDYAVNRAISLTEDTNGGATLLVQPRMAQGKGPLLGPLGRNMMMFKTFGVTMYTNMFKTLFGIASTSTDPTQRRALRRYATGVLASSAFFAGIAGTTPYGIVETVYNNLIADDEDEGFHQVASRYLGEPATNGVLNFLTDIAGGELSIGERVGLSNLVVQADRYYFDDKKSTEELMVSFVFGPGGNYVSRAYQGANKILDGDVERGMELLVPAGIRGAMRAERYEREGYKTSLGSTIIDEFTNLELIGQRMGLAPMRVIRQQLQNADRSRRQELIRKTVGELRQDYNVARFQGDQEGMTAAIEAMQEYYTENPEYEFEFTPEKLARSYRAFVQRQFEAVKGLTITDPNIRRQALMEEAREAEMERLKTQEEYVQ